MNIYNFTQENLEDFFLSRNENKAKAKIVFNWLYKNKINSFYEITALSKRVIELLSDSFVINTLKVKTKLENNEVMKLLFSLEDYNCIEAVLMKHEYGNGLCISTQVGCNMGCKFCESGRFKKRRNLYTYEMVLQVLYFIKELKLNISNVVLMGIGEPFDNYDNVAHFIKIINHSNGLGFGPRHITVSTSGLVPEIKKFAMEEIRPNLAISLHAPTDKIRNKIMPVNNVYNIKTLIGTIKNYSNRFNKKVTLEYILLNGINDSDECAEKLADLVKELDCYINLIQYNETNNLSFKRSPHNRLISFYDILKKRNISVTIRHEFGSDINAACGQLRITKGL